MLRSITTDCWTRQTTESYITTTWEFVKEDFDLKTASLSTKNVEKNHTVRNLADTLEDILTG